MIREPVVTGTTSVTRILTASRHFCCPLLPVPSVVGSGSVLILFPLPSPSPTERALRGEWSGDGKVRRGTESDKGRRYHSHFTPSLSSLVTHPSLTLFTRSHPSPRYTRRAAGREGTDRANA